MRWIGGVMLGAVAVAAVTWFVASEVMRSPAELAAEAEPPDPGPVSVPVEERALESEVVVRGTVAFDEPGGVSLAGAPDVDGQAVATRVPLADDAVEDGNVLLEVSGRPVLALEGEMPAYRDLRPGASGDDVEQLQAALVRLGHLDGEVDGQFGSATQGALESLYEGAGHEAAGPSDDDQERLRAAQERVSAAREGVEQAERRLADAGQGPSEVERLEAEAQVAEARGQVEAAEPETSQRQQARAQLEIAQARLSELTAEPDTSAEQAELDASREELTQAESELADAEDATGPWLPAGEVVYFPALPQRIDEVAIELGDEATGELLTVSSAEVVIETSIAADDAALVAVGDEVRIDAAGEEVDGAIGELAGEPGTDGADEDRHYARVDPPAEAEELLDESLRIRIPVGSTDGDVLAVPLAAVSAGADGSSRVEVVEGTNLEPDTRLVNVEPGLTADGMVEITPLDGELAPDELVVVGQEHEEADDSGPADEAGAEEEP